MSARLSGVPWWCPGGDDRPLNTTTWKKDNYMKLLTATLVAITGLGLCAAPLALASDNAAIEKQIKAHEDAWAASQLNKDHGASVVEGLLANDYHGINAKGKMFDKKQQVKRIRTDTDTYTYSKNDSMSVQVYGADVATVCGKSTEKGKDKEGKEFSRSYAWVDTWMQRGGQWHCIAGSGTLMP